jgi:hypothetical protein
MGGANGSRECAPDDKLRDTHHLSMRAARRWVSQGLNPSYRPTGKSAKTCLAPHAKIFLFFRNENQTICSQSRPTEGRFAIVTDAGRDAVDADVPITNGADADGEDVWS